MALREDFADLFTSNEAQGAIARLSPARVDLPTFSLTTTSLRHMSQWIRRLDNIANGRVGGHGNFVIDPASIGLVEVSANGPVLTQAGEHLRSMRAELEHDPARAEYELLKALYYSTFTFSESVNENLLRRQEHLNTTLSQFVASEAHVEFFAHPSLLVVAEYLASFPGAIPKLCSWPRDSLAELAELTEEEFEALGAGGSAQFRRLCKKIGAEFRRAEDRRLHHIFAMLLLDMQTTIVGDDQPVVVIPAPYNRLIQVTDLAARAEDYTEDVNIWFDHEDLRIARRLDVRTAEAGITLQAVISGQITPLTQVPAGRDMREARHIERQTRRAAARDTRVVITDESLSERAEDFAEQQVLHPRYGDNLVRVGHRQGEVLALPDGLVPGADFYVVNEADEATAFCEVKVFQGALPADVSMTRAECARALKCQASGVPYTLYLVDLDGGRVCEVSDIGQQLATIELTELVQFTLRIGAIAA